MQVEVRLSMSREQALAAHELLLRSGLTDGAGEAHLALASVKGALWAAATAKGRECVVCGAEMEGQNPRKQTCSDRCRQVLSRSKRAGVPLPMPPSSATASQPDRDTVESWEAPPSADWVAQTVNIANPPPAPANRKVWQPVEVHMGPDGVVRAAFRDGGAGFDRPYGCGSDYDGPLTTGAMLKGDGNGVFVAEPVPYRPAHWRWRFAINITDGTPWLSGLVVPQVVVETAWRVYREKAQA